MHELEPTDVEVMERLADGEAQAVSLLYDRYARVVFSLALRMTRDRGAAEDLVQDVFVTAWRSAASFDPDKGALSTWLMTIAHRRCVDWLRARMGRPVETADPAADAGVDQLASGDDVTGIAWLHERQGRVRAAVQRLDQSEREVVTLAYFSGLSQREIAERTGLPLGTVKTRTGSALGRLRGLLASEGVRDEA